MNEKKEIEIKGRKISKELFELMVKRINAMPQDIKLAVLGEILTKEDIIKEIEEESAIGKEILEMELNYYLDLIRD